MPVLPKLIYRVNVILIKISTSYCGDINKLTLKVIWRGKRPRIANMILKEKYKVGGLTLSNLKTYNNQDSVVLVKEQTNKSMEHNKEPRNRST